MREYSVPALVDIPAGGNLTDLIYNNAQEAPESIAFRRKRDGQWQDVTARQFLTEVTAIAKGLIASGVGPGDRVGIMSRTRYEWTLFDFAIWCAAAVTVPIYETSSAEQVQWILADSGAVACLVENTDHARTVESALQGLAGLKHLWQIEGGAVDTLTAAGADVADSEVDSRRNALAPDSLATLIYTSGTTGRPKGCELSHGNFLFELGNATALLSPVFATGRSSTLLFLPLAHVFARIIQIGCIQAQVTMGHAPDVKNLMNDLASFKPTFILAVPRVFEKVYNAAAQKAETQSSIKGKIFYKAADAATAYSQALDAGRPGLPLRLRHWVFDKLVYAKLRTALGGRTTHAISGGSALGSRLGHFFRGIGLVVLEGYGLTETTGASTINPPDRPKIGTAGRPLPGSAVRIADNGEIHLKGGQIFRGYWHNPEATSKDLDPAGWFHSGDIGELDADGYLRITGRTKELIVTAGGKNVAPAVIEDRIRAHPLVSQAMVVGDDKPFIAALITIDPEFLPHWKEQHGKLAEATVADLVDDDDLNATVQEAVDEGNKAVSKAESVRKFRILPADWTEEGGQLTPSMKIKRHVVMKEQAKEIEALYAESQPSGGGRQGARGGPGRR